MDKRFEKVSTDARFIKPKKDSNKLLIDPRFSAIFNSTEFDIGNLDSKGRKNHGLAKNDLSRFYKQGEEEQMNDYARGQAESESEEDEVIDEPITEQSGPWDDEVIPTGDETHRFACVNLDWDHVKSKDLYKVFDAFRSTRGSINSIKVYPSEFGRERMAKEALQGPPIAVFENNMTFNDLSKGDISYDREFNGDSDSGSDSSHSHESISVSNKGTKKIPKTDMKNKITDDQGKDFNMVALRQYQVDRLRYYYAVIDCDSTETAKAIFKACDGTEFESSSNFFDLRYIPIDMVFEGEPRDEATQAPLVYEPTEFITEALQHSNVKLTWDAEDPDRIKTTRKKFTKQDIKDMDFKAFLASDSEDNEDEGLKLKYQALVAGSEDEDEGEDMEITFAPGLTEKAEKRLEDLKGDKGRSGETVFEAKMRKQRENRKAKKMARLGKTAQEVQIEEQDSPSERDEAEMTDPFFQDAFDSDFEQPMNSKQKQKQPKKSNPTRVKKTAEEKILESNSKAELELLLMDETKTSTHFNVQDVIKSEKKFQSKKKSKKLGVLETQTDFKLDFNDPRFSSLLEDHKFHIDPTNPQFKITNTMKEILHRKRNKGSDYTKVDVAVNDSKIELSSLVSGIKRKSANQQGLGKRSKK